MPVPVAPLSAMPTPYYAMPSLPTAGIMPGMPAMPVAVGEPVGVNWQQQLASRAAQRDTMLAETSRKVSSETLAAQKEARAPSKKIGMKERQYTTDDMREMMRNKLTGKAKSAREAAE